MPRLAPHAIPATLPVLVALALIAIGPSASIGASGPNVPLAAVAWPPSTGLAVGEVVTGGASASDEFIELYNAGSTVIDLSGLEVVYATSTGGTVTRKATWASTTQIEPGRHLLIANGAGIHAAIADSVYTGGLAATGGAVAVRPIGGAAIDAIGWGDATNAFVEGSAAPAPAAGSSLERRPGGASGNGVDTNENSADWLLDPTPIAQNLAAAPVPAGGPMPTATVAPTPTASSVPTVAPTPTATVAATPTASPAPTSSTSPAPTPSPTPVPTATASPIPSPSSSPPPDPTPTPSASAPPTPDPTPNPGASATPTAAPSDPPTPSPTPEPSPTPTPGPTTTPSPTPAMGTIDIGVARTQAADSRVRIRGIVTVEPGRIVDDRTFAIQDATGGILVRLDGGRKDLPVLRGAEIVIEGRLAARYGALEVRLDGDDPLDVIGIGTLPAPQPIQLSDLSEATEARLVHGDGIVADVDRAKSGTTTIILEDATGRGRIVAFEGAGTLPDVSRGSSIAVDGIAGQRASATGRLDGYRIWVRDGADLQVATPTPTASPSQEPSASPSASPTVVTIAAARLRPGQKVVVEGIVTSPGGFLDAEGRRVTIQDATAAILLRLAARETAPRVGSRVRIAGSVGTYYGSAQLSATGPAERIGSAATSAKGLQRAPGADLEWQLVRIEGTVVDVKRTGEAWHADLVLAGSGARVPVAGLARAGIAVERVGEGDRGTVVGIVRRAYPTATDRRFAVLPRGPADLDLTAAASTASRAPGGGATSSSAGAAPDADDSSQSNAAVDSAPAAVGMEAGELSANLGRLVRIGGLVVRVQVSAAAGSAPVIELDDGTGVIPVRLPTAALGIAAAIVPSDLVEVVGTIEASGDHRVAVVVDDVADIVVAGQASETRSETVPETSVSGAEPAGAASGTPSIDPGSRQAADPEAASMTRLMGAAGAGVVLAAIVVTGAVGARWRRTQARRQASRQATERLVELLSSAPEASPRGREVG